MPRQIYSLQTRFEFGGILMCWSKIGKLLLSLSCIEGQLVKKKRKAWDYQAEESEVYKVTINSDSGIIFCVTDMV